MLVEISDRNCYFYSLQNQEIDLVTDLGSLNLCTYDNDYDLTNMPGKLYKIRHRKSYNTNMPGKLYNIRQTKFMYIHA